MLNRRHMALATLALPALGRASQAQPARPVNVIIPFAGGSASDVVGRLLLERMGELLGQRFVVDNRPGASGNLGALAAARAEPDGHTLLLAASGPLAVNQFLFRNMGYDPLTAFAPIALIATLPNLVVVHPSLPVQNIAELAALARARPGEINYGSIGNGSSQHLAGALFEQVMNVRMTHVPYRITGQLVTDLVAGRVQASFQLIPNVLQQVQAGQLRALAVTSPARAAALPEVPTAAEQGATGFEAFAWFALVAPRGTPVALLERFHGAYGQVIADAALRRRIVELGAEPAPAAPMEALGRFMAAEAEKWGNLIRANNITAE